MEAWNTSVACKLMSLKLWTEELKLGRVDSSLQTFSSLQIQLNWVSQPLGSRTDVHPWIGLTSFWWGVQAIEIRGTAGHWYDNNHVIGVIGVSLSLSCGRSVCLSLGVFEESIVHTNKQSRCGWVCMYKPKRLACMWELECQEGGHIGKLTVQELRTVNGPCRLIFTVLSRSVSQWFGCGCHGA